MDSVETLLGLNDTAEKMQAAAPSVQRMAVRVGDLGLLMRWEGGREVILAPPVSHIPHTVSWLCGLANVRGALVPVVDLAQAFNVARANIASYLLICGQGDDAMGLLIDGLPRVFDVDVSRQLPLPPDVPTLLQDSVITVYEKDGRPWLDIDLDSLFKTLGHEIALASVAG